VPSIEIGTVGAFLFVQLSNMKTLSFALDSTTNPFMPPKGKTEYVERFFRALEFNFLQKNKPIFSH